MIMLADWHPDIIEFIISKMQNPNILRHIINTTKDEQIKRLAREKLKFEPLTEAEKLVLEYADDAAGTIGDDTVTTYTQTLLSDGGRYTVHNPDFLTGANISVAITHEFMQAVENDEEFPLQFPDVENYDAQEMEYYNEYWHKVGDIRDWPLPIKTYRTIRARDLWDLINICATYSAEPG